MPAAAAAAIRSGTGIRVTAPGCRCQARSASGRSLRKNDARHKTVVPTRTIEHMLVGRASQCAQIDALLARLSHGCGGSIVVSGEPGLGKTALLDYAADAASASALAPLVVWARGWESESELPFAALGDVVRPLSDALDELPESQRSSLRVALGVGQAVVEDRLTVYVAAHALLSVSAERRPVVVLIDDAQWLDQGSAQALAFAARRLRHEPVVMIAATRPNADVDLSGLEVITLEPLGDRDSRELLSRSPGMDGAAAELIMRQAGGLPLALIELPRLLSGGELRGPTDGAPMPIGSRLSELYGKLLSELPAATRRAALIAAADDRGDLLGISRALGSTGLSVHALEPAESSGVLMLTDHRVHFRHPLIRSAVYHGADPAERRAAHAALAAGMSDDGQFAERAWHRAAATAAPDAEVSRDLVTAAAQARARGAFPTAASMYERAAALAVSAHDRGSLLADAADAAQFDSPQRARMLLDRAAQDSGNGDLEAHIGRLRGRMEARGGSARLAHQVIVAAARSSASDPSAAARLLIESVDPAIRAGLVSAALESALEANELARRAGDDSAVLYAELAEAAARVFAGDAARGRDLVVRVAEQAAATGEMSQDPQLTAYLGAILGFAEQLGRAQDALERQVASARRASAPGRLVYPLIALAWVQRLAGGWQLASANLTEAVGLARETAQESDECWALGLLTWITETQGTGGGAADPDRLLQLARRLDLPFQELVAHAARAAGARRALGSAVSGAGRARRRGGGASLRRRRRGRAHVARPGGRAEADARVCRRAHPPAGDPRRRPDARSHGRHQSGPSLDGRVRRASGEGGAAVGSGARGALPRAGGRRRGRAAVRRVASPSRRGRPGSLPARSHRTVCRRMAAPLAAPSALPRAASRGPAALRGAERAGVGRPGQPRAARDRGDAAAERSVHGGRPDAPGAPAGARS